MKTSFAQTVRRSILGIEGENMAYGADIRKRGQLKDIFYWRFRRVNTRTSHERRTGHFGKAVNWKRMYD